RVEGVVGKPAAELGAVPLEVEAAHEATGPISPSRRRQQVRKVERVGPGVARLPLAEQLYPADGLVDGAETERGQQRPHLLGDEQQVLGDALGGAGELGP